MSWQGCCGVPACVHRERRFRKGLPSGQSRGPGLGLWPHTTDGMSRGEGPASTGRWLPSLDLSLTLPEREGQTAVLEIEQNGEEYILGSSVVPLSSEPPADSLRAASYYFLPEGLHLYHLLALLASPQSSVLPAS